tara:strand:- start:468 stop:851 length:384 start_codon:yes stop_codon:yes gene_type:complete
MAKRPKRTYNVTTGEWEVEKLWDSRDDQGRYFKDGVQVDSSGRPWEPMTEEQAALNTSTPGTGVGGGPLPEMGDETISPDDPRNLTFGSSQSSSGTIGGGYGKKRIGKVSRGQMNLTGSQGRSILTS